jgi:hypothetical protein
MEDYARRVAAWEDTEGQPIEEHVQHCSPCYREFLDIRERLRKESPPSEVRMSWFRRRRISKTLDRLEALMMSVTEEVRRGRAGRRA